MNFEMKSEVGFEHEIGGLVAMLTHARETTLADIADIPPEVLHDETYGNSIASILWHITAVEWIHQILSFEERDPTDAELAEWRSGIFFEEQSTASLHSLVETMGKVRTATLAGLKEQNSHWLHKRRTWHNGVHHNAYYLWYHVMEDEINHRGQIRLLKRLLTT